MAAPSANITVIVGAQWGDEGKGKITDYFAGQADFVVRFHGGNNAGHTVIVDNDVYKLHLIPSGVLYPHPTSVIGNGVVVDPHTLIGEIEGLRARGIDPKLLISERAHVILPYHITLDEALTGHQGALAAGSTRRGIAPVYADKAYRHGIRMVDLLEPEIFREKLEISYTFNKQLIQNALGKTFSHSMEDIFTKYIDYGQQLSRYIRDTSFVLYTAHKKGQQILFEGAQGISLDVDHGIYPHTTSSNTVAGHIATGTGVSFRDINRIIGVSKAYVTRVGISPFPTEIEDDRAGLIREKGSEYGTTTGRPRRVGWLDLVQIRQAVRVNGLTEIALTKLDVLTGIKELPVCVAYEIDGTTRSEMPASLTQYRKTKPVYQVLPGWDAIDPDTLEKGSTALPDSLKRYIEFIENAALCPVRILSLGPQRHETILQ